MITHTPLGGMAVGDTGHKSKPETEMLNGSSADLGLPKKKNASCSGRNGGP